MTIRVTNTRVPTAQDAQYAVGRIGFIARNNPTDLYNKATAAGFVHQGNNEYVHSDGSWVRLEANGIINRGIGGTQLQGIPGGRAAAAQPAQPAAATYQAGGTGQIDRSRPGVPASMRNYAIAQTGIVTAATAPGICARLGFVQSGSTWIHPDGSWVDTAGGRVTVGWKGHSLRELPYSRSGGWR